MSNVKSQANTLLIDHFRRVRYSSFRINCEHEKCWRRL